MGKGKVRLKSAKGKRWRKGHSGSSNPESNKHRQAARGKFDSHLSLLHRATAGLSLTAEALASHDAIQDDKLAVDRTTPGLGDEGGDTGEGEEEQKSTSRTATAASSAYSLIDTAHPVFGKVKKMWNSPLESHREICAVLAAVSEVIKSHDGKDSETEYFGALMTVLESAEEEKSVTAIVYLLSIIMPKVQPEVLQSSYSAVCRVIMDKLSAHETSDSTALLKTLVTCLTCLLTAQDVSVWSDSYTQRVFQSLLNFTIHPKPKLRKSAQGGVVSLLREGTGTGDFHPSGSLTARHCKHVIEKGGAETPILHILGMLKECLANFTTQHIKTLCETILKLMTLGNSVIRSTGLRALHGLFTSLAGPQGITQQLNGQLISALYDYQPSMVDAQLLQAWLTVMQSAHTRLATLEQPLALAHFPRLFTTCISCMLSEKTAVNETAAAIMETILKECVGPFLDSSDPKSSDGKIKSESHIQMMFKAVESGLKYKYYSSWDRILRVLRAFYQVAGKHCHGFMTKSLVSLCELRSTVNFPYTSELDAAFGAAVRSMGPRTVLTAVPLLLDTESDPPDFPRSWMLPLMKDHIRRAQLGYFTEAMLPLAGRLRAKAQQYSEANKPLEAKLYDTLQLQVWSLLPGFCTEPIDLEQSFRPIARILGTALNERQDLRAIVCQALRLLIEGNKDNVQTQAELARFSKNYLPILFNLYTSDPKPGDPARESVLDCVRAYVSITEQKLLESFYAKAYSKLTQKDLPTNTKCLVFDLVHTFVPHLSLGSLNELFLFVTPLLDSSDGTTQKKAYTTLEHMLSSEGPTHQSFLREHLEELRTVLLESLSTASLAAKKPRLKCLLHISDHLTPDSSNFIAAIAPEVILCTKEVSEKVRFLSFQLLVNLGYAAQRCFQKNAEDSVTDYLMLVLAGLAGSPHMISATLLSLSRLVYEFHDLLDSAPIKRLLSSCCLFLSSRTREVVKAALRFVKVTIGVLPPTDLAPHVEDLVLSILNWSENSRSHFRMKSRVILERLIRKFSFQMIASMVPVKHQKLVIHIRKMNRRQKNKKQAKADKGEPEVETDVKKHHKPSYEELLYDSSEEEEEQKWTKSRKASKGARRKQSQSDHGQAWIKEDIDKEPVDFLDPSVIKSVIATNPAKMRRKRAVANPFLTNPEGKLVIAEGEEERRTGREMDDMEIDDSEAVRIKRKRKLEVTEELGEEETKGGGVGIHRKNAARLDFDYGAEYRSKKAKGDVKKVGKPAPYAYMPLLRQKLNRRKRAKLAGQFSGLMNRAKKGSAHGAKQLHRRRR